MRPKSCKLWMVVVLVLIYPLVWIQAQDTTKSSSLSKMYESTALIRIRTEDRSDTRFETLTIDAYLDVEIGRIKDSRVLKPVVEKLGLQKIWGARLFNGKDLPLEQAIVFLQRRIEIKHQSNSEIVEIHAKSEVPKEAAEIANAIADIYADLRRVELEARKSRMFEVLDRETTKQAEVVKRAQEKVEKLRKELNVDIGGNAMQPMESEWQRKSALLEEARAEFQQRRIRLDRLSKLSDEELLNALSAMGVEDNNVTVLLGKKNGVESDLAQMRKSGLEDSNPRIKSREAELTKLVEQLKSVAKGKRQALDIDLQVTQNRVAVLEKETMALGKNVDQQKTAGLSKFREAVHERDREALIYEQFRLRQNQEKVNRAVIVDSVVILSRAEPSAN